MLGIDKHPYRWIEPANFYHCLQKPYTLSKPIEEKIENFTKQSDQIVKVS